uniref:Hydantoinase B/oxoprolinase domain-containing protein n=1 Tax=Chelydra serpentina TaxID=8475 RepID=A0A8C3SN46_CHESE
TDLLPALHGGPGRPAQPGLPGPGAGSHSQGLHPGPVPGGCRGGGQRADLAEGGGRDLQGLRGLRRLPGESVGGRHALCGAGGAAVELGSLGAALPPSLIPSLQGCMNNVTFGNEHVGYYETVAGGAGAGPHWHGRSGVHTHMTNTRITDPEILEKRYPVILRCFELRRGSGGSGRFRGGDGVIRELLFREEVMLSVLSERRAFCPYGLHGDPNPAAPRPLPTPSNCPAPCGIPVCPPSTLPLSPIYPPSDPPSTLPLSPIYPPS